MTFHIEKLTSRSSRRFAFLALGWLLGGSPGLASTIIDSADLANFTDRDYRDLGATHPEVGQVGGGGLGGSMR